MKLYNRFFISLLILLMLVVSCKPKKEIIKRENQPVLDRNTAAIWKAVEESEFDYTWYYAKADAHMKSGNFEFGAKADIRLRRDSALIISVKKFGFELARAMINKDSAFVFNRLDGSFMAMSIESLKEEYDIPFGFQELQQMVVNNPITEDQIPLSSMKSDEGYIFRTSNKTLAVEYVVDDQFRIKATHYQDNKGRKFSVELDDYKPFAGAGSLASQRFYFYPEKDNAEYMLKVRMEKIEIDKPKKMKFEIPGN